MTDIQSIDTDIKLLDTVIYRADNLLKTQIGKLVYAADFGIELDFFLNADFEISTLVFENYIQQVIGEYGISIIAVEKIVEKFKDKLKLTLTDNNTAQMIGG